jgi:hypothetical protein
MGQPKGELAMPDSEKKPVIRKKLKYPNPSPDINAFIEARMQLSKGEAFAERIIGANGPFDMKVVWAPSQSRFEYHPSVDPKAGQRITWGLISASTLLPLAFIVVVLLGLPLLRNLLDLALRNIPVVTQIVAFTFIVGLGVGLYVSRCRFQMAYGVLECGVGVVTAWYVANNLRVNDPLQWLSFLAGLYIIVRGADNIHKSLKGAPFEMHWNKFFFGKHPLPS